MSKLYATIQSDRSEATRTSTRSMKATAQSYDGSVSVRLAYHADGLYCEIRAEEGSTANPHDRMIYSGPLADLLTATNTYQPR